MLKWLIQRQNLRNLVNCDLIGFALWNEEMIVSDLW